MAASVAGTTHIETHLSAPPETVWGVVGDLEGELPHILPDVRTMRVVRGSIIDPRFEALATGYLGQRARFDVLMEPGYCWMQSRFLLGGFAAVAEDGGTRLGFLGGFRFPGIKTLSPALHRPGHAFAKLVVRRIEGRVQAARSRRPAA
ncbi:SRPBCC family protein [Streptomyces sp. NPDC046876]|uniref:SRPBCC family protein n=1 Tax=Streptomyces sp. NPDC046876 TaxID=3155616 RepID=UPI0033F5025D